MKVSNSADAPHQADGYDVSMKKTDQRAGGVFIAEWRKAKRLNQDQLAELINTTKGTVSKLETGGMKVTMEWLSAISRALGLSLNDLLSPPPDFTTHRYEDLDFGSPPSSSFEPDRDGDVSRVPFDDEIRDKLHVPDGGIIEVEPDAGMGEGEIVQHIYVREGKEVTQSDPIKPDVWLLPREFRNELGAPASQVIIVSTDGDSMSPTLAPRDRVFVDTRHKRPSPDGIYCLRDKYGALIVKRLHNAGAAGLMVVSDNPMHPTRPFEPDEETVIGKVIAAIKKF